MFADNFGLKAELARAVQTNPPNNQLPKKILGVGVASVGKDLLGSLRGCKILGGFVEKSGSKDFSCEASGE